MRRIFIQTLTAEKLGLVEEEDRIKEVVFDRPDQKTEAGNIYLGKVINIEKSLQAAFVSYGSGKMGFLNKKELPKSRTNPKKPIESLITEGQQLIVQVTKEAYQKKGAVLTANITLPGTNLVYLPWGGYIAVSKKLKKEKADELKREFSGLVTEGEGAIIRTSAATVLDSLLKQEFIRLQEEWKRIEKNTVNATIPSLLWEDNFLPDRLLQKYASVGIDAVICDQTELANSIRRRFPAMEDKTFWNEKWEGELPVSISQIIGQLANPSVSVPGGAELVVEQTEAMAVIDVNSRFDVKKATKNETALQVNMAVIPELITQIRLRNLSGMIIIDFISMKAESDRKKVIHLLKKELKKDLVRTEVYGFTALGLLEMTRKREQLPVSLLLTEEKKRKMMSLSSRSQAYQLERELIFRSKHASEAILIEIHPAVFQAFQSFLPSSCLLEMKKQTVYSRITEETDGYEIRLEGTSHLVEDYIQSKYPLDVDKLF